MKNPYSLVNFKSLFPSCTLWVLFASPLLFLIFHMQLQMNPTLSMSKIISQYLFSIVYLILICYFQHLSKIRKFILKHSAIAHVKHSGYEFTSLLTGFYFCMSYIIWFINLADLSSPYFNSIFLLHFVFLLLFRNEAILTKDSIFFELYLIPLKDISAYSIYQDTLVYHLHIHTESKAYPVLRTDKIIVDQLRVQLDMIDIPMIDYVPETKRKRKKI